MLISPVPGDTERVTDTVCKKRLLKCLAHGKHLQNCHSETSLTPSERGGVGSQLGGGGEGAVRVGWDRLKASAWLTVRQT